MRTLIAILCLCLPVPANAAEYVAYYIGTPSATLYAFPAHQSLTDFDTYDVPLTEGTGDDAGRYWATLDSDDGELWYLFNTATPTDWDDAISAVSLASASDVLAAVEAIDAKIGTPADTVSADIAANASSLATLDTKVDDIPTNAEVATESELAAAFWGADLSSYLTADTGGKLLSDIWAFMVKVGTEYNWTTQHGTIGTTIEEQ